MKESGSRISEVNYLSEMITYLAVCILLQI